MSKSVICESAPFAKERRSEANEQIYDLRICALCLAEGAKRMSKSMICESAPFAKERRSVPFLER